MIISILGTLAEMEKKISRERQLEGIAIAKLNKKYTGRAKGSNEDVLKFLSKPKNSKAVEYIKKGYKNIEVAKIVGVHINTITKIRKIANLIK
jgi:DNA invertase Pin-like site-specific DNA recombinase